MHGQTRQQNMKTVVEPQGYLGVLDIPVVLVPICKNKNGDVSDTGDNRLVSLATIVLRQNILNMRKNRNSPLLQQQDRNSMFLNFLQYGIKI